MYEERNKLRTQLTQEESQYLEDRLVKVEHTIEQRENEIKMYRERLLPTRTMNDILSDREVTLREKLRELFRRRGVSLVTIVTAITVIIASIGVAIGVGGQEEKRSPTSTPP